MVRVINNNLWTPVPWGFGCGGHSCGGNNWMQKMFGYQMLFNMMQNIGRCYATPPQQQGGFYPGLYLGGGGGGAAMPQNYEEYLQQQQDAQSLTELKSAYSEFNIRKIGDRYFAYLKSDKTQRIEADSVDELMDGLNEYVDQNPDKFKAKPAKAETSNEETVDNTSTGNDNTTTGTEGAGAPATSNNNNSNAASNNSANPNTGVKVPQGWHHNINQAWIKENFTNKNITTPTAEQIMLAFNGNNTLNINGISSENKAKLLNDLRQYNPSCFNPDGTGKSPFPWDKLDIPGTNVLKTTYGVPEKAKATTDTPAHSVKKCPGSSCRYEFFDNGVKIPEKDYAQKYPKEYLRDVINLDNKYWAPEDLRYALELYDKYIGGTSQYSNALGSWTRKHQKNNFKEISIRNGKLWMDYKDYRSHTGWDVWANYTLSFNSQGYKIGKLGDIYDEANICISDNEDRNNYGYMKSTPEQQRQYLGI